MLAHEIETAAIRTLRDKLVENLRVPIRSGKMRIGPRQPIGEDPHQLLLGDFGPIGLEKSVGQDEGVTWQGSDLALSRVPHELKIIRLVVGGPPENRLGVEGKALAESDRYRNHDGMIQRFGRQATEPLNGSGNNLQEVPVGSAGRSSGWSGESSCYSAPYENHSPLLQSQAVRHRRQPLRDPATDRRSDLDLTRFGGHPAQENGRRKV